MSHEKTGRVQLGVTPTDTGGKTFDVDRHGEPVASSKEKKAADSSKTVDLLEKHLREILD